MESFHTHPQYDFALELYIRQKKTSKEIIDILIEKGIDPKEARQLAFDIEVNVDQFLRAKGQKEVITGMLMFCGGLLSTFFSYSHAVDRGGGIYIIKIGLIVGGIIMIIRGAQRLM